MEKSFKKLLIDLGISSEDSIKKFHDRVRDTDEVSVLKCHKSGVYFLNNNDFGSEDVYKNISDFDYWNRDWNKHKANQKNGPKIFDDDIRRVEQFTSFIKDKTWLDFGCGSGGALRAAAGIAKEALGLEIQPGPRDFLNTSGIKCLESLDEIENESLDLITLFHVYEHLSSPIDILDKLSSKLVSGGKLIIEVPQANDVLLSLFDLASFKDFTFWSEHLILHTRSSLSSFISECSSLDLEVIEGYQRYPLSNHLYWLSKNLPGGHEKWSFLNNNLLHEAYTKTLQSIDKTDTLIAFVRKK